jgi:hypothetical protein
MRDGSLDMSRMIAGRSPMKVLLLSGNSAADGDLAAKRVKLALERRSTRYFERAFYCDGDTAA